MYHCLLDSTLFFFLFTWSHLLFSSMFLCTKCVFPPLVSFKVVLFIFSLQQFELSCKDMFLFSSYQVEWFSFYLLCLSSLWVPLFLTWKTWPLFLQILFFHFLPPSHLPLGLQWYLHSFVLSCRWWKMMLWKFCTQYASKFGKLSRGHRTGKGQFSFQSQRKAMNAKECSNYRTTVLISHTSKGLLKFSKPSRNSMWNINFQMLKLVLEKAEEQEIKLPTSAGWSKKQESSRKTSTSA